MWVTTCILFEGEWVRCLMWSKECILETLLNVHVVHACCECGVMVEHEFVDTVDGLHIHMK